MHGEWLNIGGNDYLRDTYLKAAERKRLKNLPNPALLVVRFDEDGNFTTAIVQGGNKGHNVMVTGAAKRRPDDRPNRLIGRTIALTRALRRLNAVAI